MTAFTEEDSRPGSAAAQDDDSTGDGTITGRTADVASVPTGTALVAAFVVVSALGCTDLFSTSTEPRPTFNAVVAGDSAPQAYSASAGSGFMRFRGNVRTENRCQQMKAELDEYSESDGRLGLVVDINTLEPCPNDQETVWNYLITLTDLPPGDYGVSVEHRFEGSGSGSEVVFEGDVTVESD